MSWKRTTTGLLAFALLTGPCGPLASRVAEAGTPRDPFARDPRLVLPVAAQRAQDAAPTPAPRRRSVLPVIVSAAGLIGGLTLAVVLKNDADDLYDQYLVTADPAAQEELFARAERRDRLSLVGWVIAQASLVWFFFSLIRESEKPLIPTEGPVTLTPSPSGAGLGLRVTP